MHTIIVCKQNIYNKLLQCFSVPIQPGNVMVVRENSTTMRVSWDQLTLVELRGFANYTVTYTIAGGSGQAQVEHSVTVPWTANSVVIRNLQPGAGYNIIVNARTSNGMSSMLVYTQK